MEESTIKRPVLTSSSAGKKTFFPPPARPPLTSSSISRPFITTGSITVPPRRPSLSKSVEASKVIMGNNERSLDHTAQSDQPVVKAIAPSDNISKVNKPKSPVKGMTTAERSASLLRTISKEKKETSSTITSMTAVAIEENVTKSEIQSSKIESFKSITISSKTLSTEVSHIATASEAIVSSSSIMTQVVEEKNNKNKNGSIEKTNSEIKPITCFNNKDKSTIDKSNDSNNVNNVQSVEVVTMSKSSITSDVKEEKQQQQQQSIEATSGRNRTISLDKISPHPEGITCYPIKPATPVPVCPALRPPPIHTSPPPSSSSSPPIQAIPTSPPPPYEEDEDVNCDVPGSIVSSPPDPSNAAYISPPESYNIDSVTSDAVDLVTPKYHENDVIKQRFWSTTTSITQPPAPVVEVDVPTHTHDNNMNNNNNNNNSNEHGGLVISTNSNSPPDSSCISSGIRVSQVLSIPNTNVVSPIKKVKSYLKVDVAGDIDADNNHTTTAPDVHMSIIFPPPSLTISNTSNTTKPPTASIASIDQDNSILPPQDMAISQRTSNSNSVSSNNFSELGVVTAKSDDTETTAGTTAGTTGDVANRASKLRSSLIRHNEPLRVVNLSSSVTGNSNNSNNSNNKSSSSTHSRTYSEPLKTTQSYGNMSPMGTSTSTGMGAPIAPPPGLSNTTLPTPPSRGISFEPSAPPAAFQIAQQMKGSMNNLNRNTSNASLSNNSLPGSSGGTSTQSSRSTSPSPIRRSGSNTTGNVLNLTASGRIMQADIPRPTRHSSSTSILYNTLSTSGRRVPPSSVYASFQAVDTGNASPRYLRSTFCAPPTSAKLLRDVVLPFGLLVQPFAPCAYGEQHIPVVDLSVAVQNDSHFSNLHSSNEQNKSSGGILGSLFGSNSGTTDGSMVSTSNDVIYKALPPRCTRCNGYMNCFVSFLDDGNLWCCNLCKQKNTIPDWYHCSLDGNSQRLDRYMRQELHRGSVEYIVSPEDYSYRTIQPSPTYIFAVDVSLHSVNKGYAAACFKSIRSNLKTLPENALVGICTYNSSSIQLYQSKAFLAEKRSNTQMNKNRKFPKNSNILGADEVSIHTSSSVDNQYVNSLNNRIDEEGEEEGESVSPTGQSEDIGTNNNNKPFFNVCQCEVSDPFPGFPFEMWVYSLSCNTEYFNNLLISLSATEFLYKLEQMRDNSSTKSFNNTSTSSTSSSSGTKPTAPALIPKNVSSVQAPAGTPHVNNFDYAVSPAAVVSLIQQTLAIKKITNCKVYCFFSGDNRHISDGFGFIRSREFLSQYGKPEELVTYSTASVVSQMKEVPKDILQGMEAYVALKKQLLRDNISVDVFLYSHVHGEYKDVPMLNELCTNTGGMVYVTDGDIQISYNQNRLELQLQQAILKLAGNDVTIKLRTSIGYKFDSYHGIGIYDSLREEISLCSITTDNSMSFTLKSDATLKDEEPVFVQLAVLYTTYVNVMSSDMTKTVTVPQRRVRLHNLCVYSSNNPMIVFKHVDLEALTACMFKQAVGLCFQRVPWYDSSKSGTFLSSKPNQMGAIEYIKHILVKSLEQYRILCTPVNDNNTRSSGKLILPDTLRFFPLYTLGMIKHPALVSNKMEKSVRINVKGHQRSYHLNTMLQASLLDIMRSIYPRVFALHSLVRGDGEIIRIRYIRSSAVTTNNCMNGVRSPASRNENNISRSNSNNSLRRNRYASPHSQHLMSRSNTSIAGMNTTVGLNSLGSNVSLVSQGNNTPTIINSNVSNGLRSRSSSTTSLKSKNGSHNSLATSENTSDSGDHESEIMTKLPDKVCSPTAEALNSDGLYLIDDGSTLWLYIGRNIPQVNLEKWFRNYSTPYYSAKKQVFLEFNMKHSEACRMYNIIQAVSEQHTIIPDLKFIYADEPPNYESHRFNLRLIEDSIFGELSYTEYLCSLYGSIRKPS